eukprot:scaffold85063_cov65-Phaeocystis_antarctica.AAC.5
MEVSRTDRWPGITDRVDKPMSSAVALMHGHVGSPGPPGDSDMSESTRCHQTKPSATHKWYHTARFLKINGTTERRVLATGHHDLRNPPLFTLQGNNKATTKNTIIEHQAAKDPHRGVRLPAVACAALTDLRPRAQGSA